MEFVFGMGMLIFTLRASSLPQGPRFISVNHRNTSWSIIQLKMHHKDILMLNCFNLTPWSNFGKVKNQNKISCLIWWGDMAWVPHRYTTLTLRYPNIMY